MYYPLVLQVNSRKFSHLMFQVYSGRSFSMAMCSEASLPTNTEFFCGATAGWVMCEAHYSTHSKARSMECNENYNRTILYGFRRRRVSQPSDSGQRSDSSGSFGNKIGPPFASLHGEQGDSHRQTDGLTH